MAGLNIGSEIFERVIERASELDFPEDQMSDMMDALVNDDIEKLAVSFDVLSSNVAEQIRSGHVKLVAEVGSKWRTPLNLLALQWAIAQEVIAGHAAPSDMDDLNVYEALVELAAKGLLISNEIRCLLEGGYPDGAMSRWRSLYEVVIISRFLKKHGSKAVDNYRLNAQFVRKREQAFYIKHSDRLNAAPLTEDEVQEAIKRYEEARVSAGKTYQGEYGWADEFLGQKGSKLDHLEADVELDHWRPFYKLASKHTHAGYLERGSLLADDRENTFYVGPSTSGLAGPIDMCSVSINHLVQNFLSYPRLSSEEHISIRVLHAINQKLQAIFAQ